jgi:propionyl-CoA synthetase
LPIRPDPPSGEDRRAEPRLNHISSPIAIRAEEAGPAFMKRHDLSSLRYLFLAGEPLDEPTARWAADSLGVAIVDNYW